METQQNFGSQNAIDNLDRLGNTAHRISVIKSGISPEPIPRKLD
jgi:hypothetical protein